jgi:hypothetical protein
VDNEKELLIGYSSYKKRCTIAGAYDIIEPEGPDDVVCAWAASGALVSYRRVGY